MSGMPARSRKGIVHVIRPPIIASTPAAAASAPDPVAMILRATAGQGTLMRRRVRASRSAEDRLELLLASSNCQDHLVARIRCPDRALDSTHLQVRGMGVVSIATT